MINCGHIKKEPHKAMVQINGLTLICDFLGHDFAWQQQLPSLLMCCLNG